MIKWMWGDFWEALDFIDYNSEFRGEIYIFASCCNVIQSGQTKFTLKKAQFQFQFQNSQLFLGGIAYMYRIFLSNNAKIL